MRRTALGALGLAALATALPASAQPRLPFPSPAASVSQEIGTSRVTVEYHRPAVRGRVRGKQPTACFKRTCRE